MQKLLFSIYFIFFLSISPAFSISVADSIPLISDSIKSNRVRIDRIIIVGNNKTKEKIIHRELDIRAGEVYDEDDLAFILIQDRNKIVNLRLFNSVEITTLDITPYLVEIIIKVKERWYLFPSPIFDIVDRNFNDWWQNQNHDLSRTNYGVKLYQNNFRGRNEALRLLLQFGYTKQFGLNYRIPYIDKGQQHGLNFGFNYAENKNMAFKTEDHKQVFLDSESILRLSRSFYVGYRLRKSFYTRHSASLSFNSNSVSDTIVALNPNFYKFGERTQRYFQLSYFYHRDKRDIVSYPLKGNELEGQITKYGIGIFNDINNVAIKLSYTNYSDLTHNFYLANYTSMYLSGPQDQPYSNFNALGYKNDFVRGYELYLIETQNFFLNRTTFKKQLFSIKGRLGFIPVEQFRDIPIAVYIKTYFDAGYAKNIDRYNESNINSRLSNTLIFGSGAGIDIVSSYDTVIRLEYSFNKEGESGFFFHLKKEF